MPFLRHFDLPFPTAHSLPSGAALANAAAGGTTQMARATDNIWTRELHDLVRNFAGAFLFGVPLLFTMEMWWIGDYADVGKLLLFMLLALFANVHLAYFSGCKERGGIPAAVKESVEALAVGAVASFVTLLVFNRIVPGEPLASTLGKVIIQAVPLSIGASVANALFDAQLNRTWETDEQATLTWWQATLNDLGATMAGGVFLGIALAPTDEIPMLAGGLGYGHLLGVIGFSLLLSYLIVFESDFHIHPHERRDTPRGPFQRPITETIFTYVVSLLVALLCLYLFNRIDVGDPPFFIIAQVLVLGFPTALGGAAGRLVI
jgi:putative integral membrane protein (TIGR02587 family)